MFSSLSQCSSRLLMYALFDCQWRNTMRPRWKMEHNVQNFTAEISLRKKVLKVQIWFHSPYSTTAWCKIIEKKKKEQWNLNHQSLPGRCLVTKHAFTLWHSNKNTNQEELFVWALLRCFYSPSFPATLPLLFQLVFMGCEMRRSEKRQKGE